VLVLVLGVRDGRYWTRGGDAPPLAPEDEDEHEGRGRAQPVVDRETAVHVGVVDQTLPAHGGARLLEIDAHHDFERVRIALAEFDEPARVVEPRRNVVDRTRPDHETIGSR
jgi:hypothetical protein